jgi:uncharacterized protein HemX
MAKNIETSPSNGDKNEPKSNSDSTKALGGVLVLVAAITGIYAMVRPELTSMQQTQAFYQETQKTALIRVDEKMTKIEQKFDDVASKLNDVEKALMQKAEKFAEVETQFRKEEELRKTMIDMLMKKTDEMDGDIKLHHKEDGDTDAASRTKIECLDKSITEIKAIIETMRNKPMPKDTTGIK